MVQLEADHFLWDFKSGMLTCNQILQSHHFKAAYNHPRL